MKVQTKLATYRQRIEIEHLKIDAWIFRKNVLPSFWDFFQALAEPKFCCHASYLIGKTNILNCSVIHKVADKVMMMIMAQM